MELRKNIFSAILLAVGFVLHQVVPAVGGVTFDLQLAMLFVIIAINMDIKNTILVSLASGMITALTTKFPGGQIPNMIDKAVTGMVVFVLLMLLSRIMNKNIAMIITGFVGTIVSGTVFLVSALVLVGLPVPFMVSFTAVVVPTAITNAVIAPALYYMVNISKKAAKLEF